MTPQRRRTTAIVAAAAVAITVVVIVVTVGTIPLPDVPTLQDQPEPTIPGRIAYVDTRDRDRERTCLHLVEGTAERELTCIDSYGELAGWTDDGTIDVRTFGPGPTTIVEVDPASGDVVQRRRPDDERPFPPEPGFDDGRERADGTLLDTSSDDGRAELYAAPPTGSSELLLALDGPRDYRFDRAAWSPDGRWAAVVDSADRLIVVRADGDPIPRIVAEDVGDFAWGPPALA